MSTVRLRRLTADNAKLQNYVRRHPRVRLIQAEGDPPERYQIEYRIKSLRMVGADLQEVQTHLVEVALPLNYPRTPPQCRMLSPVFHPNIAPHAICVGDHWGAGESLESIVIRIGEMLAYQSYNVKSPLNGEAARWVEQNKHRIPLDPVNLLPEEDANDPAPAANGAPAVHQMPAAPSRAPAVNPRPPSAPKSAPAEAFPVAAPPASAPARIEVKCPACGASYRVSPDWIGKNVRCAKCEQRFSCSAPGSQ
jgi:predicted Zn finger-like uncharacterized protein